MGGRGLPYRHALGPWGVYEKLGRLERANVLKVVAVAMQPLIRAGLQPLKALMLPLPTEASRSAVLANFEMMPAQIENITLLARENRDVAIDLRRMLNHQPRSAQFVAQKRTKPSKALEFRCWRRFSVARTPDLAGDPTESALSRQCSPL